MSKVIRGRDFRWPDVPLRAYQAEGEAADRFRGVTRQTLLGEGEGEGELNFLTRYFEVEPGGFSSLELHRHRTAHRGAARAGWCWPAQPRAEPLDAVRRPENPPVPGRRRPALGFLCIVDHDRDWPRPA
jgi:hypothetical protein